MPTDLDTIDRDSPVTTGVDCNVGVGNSNLAERRRRARVASRRLRKVERCLQCASAIEVCGRANEFDMGEDMIGQGVARQACRRHLCGPIHGISDSALVETTSLKVLRRTVSSIASARATGTRTVIQSRATESRRASPCRPCFLSHSVTVARLLA